MHVDDDLSVHEVPGKLGLAERFPLGYPVDNHPELRGCPPSQSNMFISPGASALLSALVMVIKRKPRSTKSPPTPQLRFGEKVFEDVALRLLI